MVPIFALQDIVNSAKMTVTAIFGMVSEWWTRV